MELVLGIALGVVALILASSLINEGRHREEIRHLKERLARQQTDGH